MLSKKSLQNIGAVITSGRKIVFVCDACKTITYLDPKSLHFKPNVELSAFVHIYPCPECGPSNSETGDKMSIQLSAE
jgi:DNA replicative helicase MCM subunit Mcm2 (Cdc46/Mcm family)